jgi:hypothetical protein
MSYHNVVLCAGHIFRETTRASENEHNALPSPPRNYGASALN